MDENQSIPDKILCVGKDVSLLETRCAVLGCAGYQSSVATPQEAAGRLETEDFSLVVISMTVTDAEFAILQIAIAPETKVLRLDHFTGPQQLLQSVSTALCTHHQP